MLREELKKRDLDPSGLKAELVARLQAAVAGAGGEQGARAAADEGNKRAAEASAKAGAGAKAKDAGAGGAAGGTDEGMTQEGTEALGAVAAAKLKHNIAAPTQDGRPNASHMGGSNRGRAAGATSSRGAGGGFEALGSGRGHRNRREGAAGRGI